MSTLEIRLLSVLSIFKYNSSVEDSIFLVTYLWTVSFLVISSELNNFQGCLGNLHIGYNTNFLSGTNSLCYLFKTHFPLKHRYLFSNISHITMQFTWNPYIFVMEWVKRFGISPIYFLDSHLTAYSLMFLVNTFWKWKFHTSFKHD